MSERIWSKKPADTGAGFDREGWNEAYPIGNGSVGAMVYGDPVRDILALNEENIWYGCGGRDRVNPRAKDAYPEVRRLLLEGRIREAQDIVGECMFATEEHQRSYSTAENVWFEYEHGGEYGDYERELDIENAVARVFYSADGHKYESAITRSSRVILFGVRGSEIAGDANLTDTFPLRGDRKAANGRFFLLTKIYYA